MHKLLARLAGAFALALFLGAAAPAHAVPSFARQSGMDCTACHMSWLELTSVGRRFKLGGYQLTRAMPEDAKRPLVTLNFDENAPTIPLAGMLQVSNTRVKNTSTSGTDPAVDFAHTNQVLLQQASLFLNGKLADHLGCFCQWTYDDAARHSSVDNIELRLADEYTGDKFNAVYGLSLNNSPTMSDIYNTTPVWGWPYAGSTVAPAPSASTLINGGLAQQVAGLSAYALLNRTFYLEAGGYRTADKLFSFLSAGVPRADRSVLDGIAPYYRLALQQDWDRGHQSGMVGLFGLSARKYPDNLNPGGPSDRYVDTGVDAQYQYITDEHRFSAMASVISERQTLSGFDASGAPNTRSNTLKQVNAKVSYYLDKWYGISVGHQRTSGSADAALYDTGSALTGSVTASPNSVANIVELNWLFSLSGTEAYRTTRLVLQYTDYQKFNGAKTNYDGFGRHAKDNNTLYLLAWLMY
jgi:hypothetical protein